MNTAQIRGKNAPPPPGRSRLRLIIQSVVFLLAVSACALFAGLVADRFPRHLDMTSTREHRLSPRTLDILSALGGEYELVVTMNSASVDPRAARRTQDVLDSFKRASPRLSVSIIDVAATDGPAQLDEVLGRILERSGDDVRGAGRSIESIVGTYPELSKSLEGLSNVLVSANEAVASTDPNAAALKKFLSDSAAICRLNAQDLAKAAVQTQQLLGQSIGRSPVPAIDAATASVREPLTVLFERLNEMTKSVEATLAAKGDVVPASVKDRLRPAANLLPKLREQIGGLRESINAQPNLPVITVARVVEQASAAIVIGPPRQEVVPGGARPRSLAAIDIESLFPPASRTAGSEGPSIDLRARTENLLGAALSSLIDPHPPIVVLTHGEPFQLAPNFDRFSELVERLRLRGIDVAEWPVSLVDQPPNLAKLNPGNARPVVYAVFYTTPDTVEGATRLINISRSIDELYTAGKPILLSVTPSTLPSLGQPDPMTELFSAVGLKIDSGRPLLRQIGTPASPLVTADIVASPGAGNPHPIASAIRGLRVRLPWALPLRPQPDASALITPFLSQPKDGLTWAESQWKDFASIPASKRSLLRPQDQPKPESQRDDAEGPWVVAAAVERTISSTQDSQRLVIVGSNTWFRDDVANAAELVDNRVRLLNPGNGELFESSVYWLARRESSIGASPEASAVPVIPADLSPGLIGAIRWGLIAGLPMLILFFGAMWRVIRG